MLQFLQVSDIQPPTINIVQQVKQKQNQIPYRLPEPKPIPPIEHSVVDGDHLSKIAEAYKTTVQRLWEKNTNITNPDLINVGDKLIVPTDAEILADRPLPNTPPPPVQNVVNPEKVNKTASVKQQTPKPAQAPSTTPVKITRGAISGNTYSYGYCTYYVKNMRPDLPNNLGNADTWYARYPGAKGTSPRAGAAAQARGLMHVVYVQAVLGNGKISITEMNYNGGWNKVSSRIANASDFLYMY